MDNGLPRLGPPTPPTTGPTAVSRGFKANTHNTQTKALRGNSKTGQVHSDLPPLAQTVFHGRSEQPATTKNHGVVIHGNPERPQMKPRIFGYFSAGLDARP